MSSDAIWTGGMAPTVKCLLHKDEDLSRIYVKLLSMASAAFITQHWTRGKRTWDLLGWQPTGTSQAKGKPISKTKPEK